MQANQTLTDAEMQAVRELRNAYNRSWWQRMTPEQRKQKRLEYELNRARRRGLVTE